MLLILILTSGFASVSTTLILSGNINFAFNSSDFNVYFSKAIENGEENNSLIKDSTNIAFVKDMSMKGEKYVLQYVVTNGSRNYDAGVEINCTESNEYLKITNDFDTENLLAAKASRNGELTVEVLKPYAGTETESKKDVEVTCTIVARPLERDSAATDPEPEPIVCTLDNPAVYEKGAWKLTDNDCSEGISNGDLITLSTESFYVYDISGDNVKALAKYRLNAGSNCPDIRYCYGSDPSYNGGLQDVNAINMVMRNSTAKSYSSSYKNVLNNMGGNVTTGRLMTKSEMVALGCDASADTCTNMPEYISLANNWWLSDSHSSSADYYYAYGNNTLFQGTERTTGVRPVIELSKSLFD